MSDKEDLELQGSDTSEFQEDPALEAELAGAIEAEDDVVDQQEDVAEVEQEAAVEDKPEVVAKAKATGHLSPEAYQAKYGTMEGYKSPEQFVKFGESYEELAPIIKSMKKQIEQRDKEFQTLIDYHKKTEQRQYERAKQELEAQLQQARDIGDVQGVEQLVREKSKLDYQEAAQQQQSALEQMSTAKSQFETRNKYWYNEAHPELVQEAQNLDIEIREGKYVTELGLPMPQNHFQLGQQIETIMRFRHPDLVGVQSKPRSVPVNPATSGVTKGVSMAGGDADTAIFNKLMKDTGYKSLYNGIKKTVESSGRHKYTAKDFVQQLRKDGEI